MMDGQKRMDDYLAAVEAALGAAVTFPAGADHRVREAMRYSLLGGGKRLRAVVTLEFCRLCAGEWRDALPFACALEMVHAYSLIHDDLPCMDDDEMRRGRPSCHVAFGEAVALLAGDALLTRAFEVMADAPLSAERRISAVRELAAAAGTAGMIGGQELDITGYGVDVDTLIALSERKTGALIRAASRCGCVAAGGSPEQLAAADRFAHCLGLSFQIVDDILDEVGDPAVLGKPVGSDAQQGKVTFASLLGRERAASLSDRLLAGGEEALAPFGEETAFLRWLTERLAHRTN